MGYEQSWIEKQGGVGTFDFRNNSDIKGSTGILRKGMVH